MSFILDALRKVEKEKKHTPSFDLKSRLLSDSGPTSTPRPMLITAGVAALVFSSAVAWAAIFYLKEPEVPMISPIQHILPSKTGVSATSAEKKPPATVVAALQIKKEIKPKEGLPLRGLGMEQGQVSQAGLGMDEYVWEEEEQIIDPIGIDTGAEFRESSLLEEDEEFSTAPAIQVYPPMQSRVSFSAPEEAAKFALEGIVFHEDSKHRSAMVRYKGERIGTLLKIGDSFKGLRVSQIEPESVIMLKDGRAVVLAMD